MVSKNSDLYIYQNYNKKFISMFATPCKNLYFYTLLSVFL